MSLSKILIILLTLTVLVFVALGLFTPYLTARRIIRPKIGTTLTVPAFAYAPSSYQADATPCITASGTRVRRGTVAANFLPMGTIIEMDGEKLIVEDRMHPRYDQAIDIFMPSTAEALDFGTQEVEITIVDYGEPGQPLSEAAGLPAEASAKAEETAASSTPSVNEKTPGAKKTPEEPDNKPTIFNQLRGRLNYLGRLFKASIPADVNRYDVNCFEE